MEQAEAIESFFKADIFWPWQNKPSGIHYRGKQNYFGVLHDTWSFHHLLFNRCRLGYNGLGCLRWRVHWEWVQSSNPTAVFWQCSRCSLRFVGRCWLLLSCGHCLLIINYFHFGHFMSVTNDPKSGYIIYTKQTLFNFSIRIIYVTLSTNQRSPWASHVHRLHSLRSSHQRTLKMRHLRRVWLWYIPIGRPRR